MTQEKEFMPYLTITVRWQVAMVTLALACSHLLSIAFIWPCRTESDTLTGQLYQRGVVPVTGNTAEAPPYARKMAVGRRNRGALGC